MPFEDDGRSRERYSFLNQPDDGEEDCQHHHYQHYDDDQDGIVPIGINPPAVPEKSSTRVAVINFFKGLFGAGVLAIPNAFSYTGIPLGVACFSLVAMACLATMLILLQCQYLVRVKRGIDVNTYEELAGVVLGPHGFRTVRFVMCGLTLIFCSAFVIVISKNMHDVFDDIPRLWWCIIAYPILLLLSWIPLMQDLWISSVFGLVVYLVAVVGTTIYYSKTHYLGEPSAMDLRWEGLPHFFGVAVYALEGINLTLPISTSMKSKRKPPYVMACGMLGFSLVTVFYSAYSYGAGYGKCDTITECLGDGKAVTVVRLALSISLLFTYPVYLIVASTIFETALLGDHDRHLSDAMDKREGSKNNTTTTTTTSYIVKVRIIRALEVALTCGVAMVLPDLSIFASLVGASGLTFVGFIMPSIIWIACIDEDTTRWNKMGVYLTAGTIVIVGLVAMVVGTTEGIRNLVAFFKDG